MEKVNILQNGDMQFPNVISFLFHHEYTLYLFQGTKVYVSSTFYYLIQITLIWRRCSCNF
jgi:hypothetical protein